VDVAAEKNSTLVMPFPVEMLRFFDQLTRVTSGQAAMPVATPAGLGQPWSLQGERPSSLGWPAAVSEDAFTHEQRHPLSPEGDDQRPQPAEIIG
jgi:hypothetical protein